MEVVRLSRTLLGGVSAAWPICDRLANTKFVRVHSRSPMDNRISLQFDIKRQRAHLAHAERPSAATARQLRPRHHRAPSNVESGMRIYIFKSETRSELRAFAGDLDGSKLPEQHGPWTAIGSVGPTKDPPHNFSRGAIEAAIDGQGFQLWRLGRKTGG